MARRQQRATTKQDTFARMEARGEPRADVFREVFGVDLETADKTTINRIDVQIYRWRRTPWYEEIWKDEIRRVSIAMSTEALKRIRHQIKDENGWLANKAANDSLTFAKPLIWGEEEKALTIKVEGMPELGMPELGTPDGDG